MVSCIWDGVGAGGDWRFANALIGNSDSGSTEALFYTISILDWIQWGNLTRNLFLLFLPFSPPWHPLESSIWKEQPAIAMMMMSNKSYLIHE